ncbi:hypothetical protein F6X56_14665 [Rhodococcus erythropolis]|uniref:hypothetical protein n=1 Tax=Rhodococcus TaxID=1827 RepID=UPI000AD328A1|nr:MULTISPECIES: hypothetical protein [Rhodococcus]MCJ0950372.1 hypothetical protein [Rhodococcus sp. ARC_M8]QEX10868.1 hypothetical protein F6X56_14665 [Rhodococcus erythropolis]UKO88881.1 hypothetical protein ITJ47_14180 [Rhodococcus erythropolis]BBE45460.1 hypothetical protein RE2895_23910 [Rhodococcus erythropolis]
MTTTRFKVGQKVILNSHDCVFAEPGETVTVTNVDGGMLYFRTSRGSYCEHSIENFEDGIKSLDNLEVGDIIVHPDGDEAKALAVLGDVFLTSGWGDFDSAAETWYTVAESKTWHWTVKQDTPEDMALDRQTRHSN